MITKQKTPSYVMIDFEWLKKEKARTVERAYNLARLAAMCDMEEGWDGDAARPISREIIAFVGGVILRINQQPEIYPTADGGVQIQYEKEDKTYLEIVFSVDGITGMRIEKGNPKEATFNDFKYDSEKEISDYIEVFNAAG